MTFGHTTMLWHRPTELTQTFVYSTCRQHCLSFKIMIQNLVTALFFLLLMNCRRLLAEHSCVSLTFHAMDSHSMSNWIQEPTQATAPRLLLAIQVSVPYSSADGTYSLGDTACKIQMSAQGCQASPREGSVSSSVLSTASNSHICAPTLQPPTPSSLPLPHFSTCWPQRLWAGLGSRNWSTASESRTTFSLPTQRSTFEFSCCFFSLEPSTLTVSYPLI